MKTLWMLLLLAALAPGCVEPAQRTPSRSVALQEGDRAPGFTLESLDRKISLSDYRGERPILLYFSMGPG